MSIDLAEINFLAVIVAILVQYAGGGAWFAVFANPWLKALGKTKEEIQAGGAPWISYGIAFIGSVLTVLALAVILQALGGDDIFDGLVLGLVCGIGFVATALAAQFSFEGRPLKLFLLDAGYPVVGLAVAGVILGVWQ